MKRDRHSDGSASFDDAATDYVTAARVASLAEAGYLVSVLQGEGLDAEVRHTKSFSAINGAWLTDYVVQAPEDQIPRVVEVLRAEAAAFEQDDQLDDEADETLRQVVWRPVAMMAVAGLVSLLAGQHFAAGHQRGGVPGLAGAVDAIDKPFYTPPAPDGSRHRLTYDRRTSQWLLDADTDGDGRFDQRSRFSNTAAAVTQAR